MYHACKGPIPWQKLLHAKGPTLVLPMYRVGAAISSLYRQRPHGSWRNGQRVDPTPVHPASGKLLIRVDNWMGGACNSVWPPDHTVLIDINCSLLSYRQIILFLLVEIKHNTNQLRTLLANTNMCTFYVRSVGVARYNKGYNTPWEQIQAW